LAQAAENRFVGVQCGILDQYTSVMGEAGKLVYLDCRNLGRGELVSIGADADLVLANTNAPHRLLDGGYNKLREDCFAAAKFFANRMPEKKITHLRDVTLDEFNQYAGDLPEVIRRRAKHIITENARVLTGVAALRKGDLKTMGECMNQSHLSSRDDFGNSSKELDVMFDCAAGLPGLYGRRLSGGGFGGCTVNLVAAGNAKEFAETLATRYKSKTKIEPTMHVCKAAGGAYERVLR
jgi:galactokinase